MIIRIGERIQELRIRNGLKQSELAEKDESHKIFC